MRPEISEIERDSYRILEQRVDLSHLPPLGRAVCARVIHATADLGYARDLVLDESALERGWAAIRDGAPIVADSAMTQAGITSRRAQCFLQDPRAPELARQTPVTRSAAGIRVAAQEVGPGAVWVIGSAPTALFELCELEVEPALVVGLCVGFVGAAEAKDALRSSGLPCVTNRGAKGGSAAAAAATNALLYEDATEETQ